MSAPTTSYGYELSIADDTDIDDTPVCCGEDMAAKGTARGGRDYTCGNCSTLVMISASGLVDDIIE
ncbi:hypothetical protein AB0I27_22385 [Streptomyces sp. NPDC050597]|uniref:hypothetical protein n=1 Tax=Streptomyces sp. NPDC050597 TaxID=3157212 RepID=UPI003448768D